MLLPPLIGLFTTASKSIGRNNIEEQQRFSENTFRHRRHSSDTNISQGAISRRETPNQRNNSVSPPRSKHYQGIQKLKSRKLSNPPQRGENIFDWQLYNNDKFISSAADIDTFKDYILSSYHDRLDMREPPSAATTSS